MEQTNTPTPVSIATVAIEEFRASLRGNVFMPGDKEYDQKRKVWNGMIDRYPALVVHCAGPSDVMRAVLFARVHELLISVKAGGHNFAGKSVCDGGMMIDLSGMRSVRVDPVQKIARVEAGCLLEDLDHETQAFGLATTAGIVSHTGVAGLTLGGGQGWLMNKYGLTIDNLLSVDMVLANGSFLKASKSENEDLFWAIRGGGGNFGIVTSLQYQLHPVGPQVLGGMVLYPLDQVKEVLRFYSTYSMYTPDEMSVLSGIFTTPDGLPVVAIVVGWIGEPEQGERHIQPLREFGTPLADLTGLMPYTQLQKMFDAAVPHGMYRYTKMGYLQSFSDDLLEVVNRYVQRLPSATSMVLFNCIKGAVARVGSSDTPFVHRHKQWHFDIFPQWKDPSEAEAHINWARSFWKEAEKFTQGTGVNFLDADDGPDRVKQAFGDNYGKLVRIKQKYDPTNFFRINSNVVPEQIK